MIMGVNEKLTNENFHGLKANATKLAKHVEQRQTFVKTKYFNKMTKKLINLKTGFECFIFVQIRTLLLLK